ncbi:MAG: hypothetical protein ACOZFS_04680 [Thermodesulfobacteriota bacterium]
MRFKSLAELKRGEAYEIELASLPQEIKLTSFAKAKAFKINELVRQIHEDSYEWYGYTLGSKENPERIVDIGLPENDENMQQYTRVSPENIAAYQQSLPVERIINGWIHSHGKLSFQGFSQIDAENQRVVLDYITTLLKVPVAKRELLIRDLVLLVEGQCGDEDLKKGSVSLITDAPIAKAKIMETVYGGFCYAIVIGDSGWHQQEIHYKRRGILSGHTSFSQKSAEIIHLETQESLTQSDIAALQEEVKHKIQPLKYVLAKLESM